MPNSKPIAKFFKTTVVFKQRQNKNISTIKSNSWKYTEQLPQKSFYSMRAILASTKNAFLKQLFPKA